MRQLWDNLWLAVLWKIHRRHAATRRDLTRQLAQALDDVELAVLQAQTNLALAEQVAEHAINDLRRMKAQRDVAIAFATKGGVRDVEAWLAERDDQHDGEHGS